VPSGVFSPKATCILGNGMVINPAVLISELDILKERGIDISRLVISDRANLIMPYHMLLDGLEEDSRGSKAIGTTRKGIGPAFSDKVARLGIRAGDILDRDGFRERLSHILENKNAILTRLYGVEPLSLEQVYEDYCRYAERLAPFIRETITILAEAINRDDMVLLEGAQGTLLDPDFGTYPYGTSSSPTAAGSVIGSGIGPTRLNRVLGVYKAYCTRVGTGPMPTELHDETGDLIRERAHEYGTTTGRPRRCGWFDAVAARFSHQVNNFTGMAITRLDILDSLPSLKICVRYQLEGKETDCFPANVSHLEKCQPVYEELPGWQCPTSGIREYGQLPPQARQYLERLEELTSCPVSVISVGAAREETIIRRDIL